MQNHYTNPGTFLTEIFLLKTLDATEGVVIWVTSTETSHSTAAWLSSLQQTPQGKWSLGSSDAHHSHRFLVRLHTAPVKDVGAAAVCRYNLSTAKAPTEVESLTHSPISTVTVY